MGAAACGLRPVVEMMLIEFVGVALDQQPPRRPGVAARDEDLSLFWSFPFGPGDLPTSRRTRHVPQRDPIDLFAGILTEEGLIGPGALDRMKGKVREAVESPVAHALASSRPNVAEILARVTGLRAF